MVENRKSGSTLTFAPAVQSHGQCLAGRAKVQVPLLA
jgi:hypothetical protein